MRNGLNHEVWRDGSHRAELAPRRRSTVTCLKVQITNVIYAVAIAMSISCVAMLLLDEIDAPIHVSEPDNLSVLAHSLPYIQWKNYSNIAGFIESLEGPHQLTPAELDELLTDQDFIYAVESHFYSIPASNTTEPTEQVEPADNTVASNPTDAMLEPEPADDTIASKLTDAMLASEPADSKSDDSSHHADIPVELTQAEISDSSIEKVDEQLPPDTVGSCIYNDLTCKHGSYIPKENCSFYALCPTEGPTCDLRVNPNCTQNINWWNQMNCTCPPAYSGTDCSIANPPNPPLYDCPVDHHIWDSSPININNPDKHLECFLDFTPSQYQYSLRLHRAELFIKMFAEGDGNGVINFRLLSRHRDGSTTFYLCYPAQADLTCNLGDCKGVTYTDSGEAHYECGVVDCTSCGPEKNCSAILYVLALTMKPPMKLVFTNIDRSTGESHLTFITTSVTLELHCSTGECMNTPIDLNEHEDPLKAHAWITLALVGGACGGLGLLMCVAMCSARRSQGKELAMHADEDPEEFRQKLNLLLSDQVSDLPSFGMYFDEVTYTVAIENPFAQGGYTTRKVLKGVTGYIRPGELVAILGSSGAGKSSLLDILATRYRAGSIGGHVGLMSSSVQAPPRSQWRDVMSYVLQDDLMLHTMTVREALLFSAKIRLPSSYTQTMIHSKVSKLMEDLRIDHIADSRIGSSDAGGGISGGERKRLAIGMELVADPRILLLDEPTSGLDSFSTEVVLEVLKKTCEAGCTCILTIHQPATKIYNMFDEVLLMTRNGQQAYFGPPTAAIEYFSRLGYKPEHRWINPAEHILNVTAQPDDSKLLRIANAFRTSEEYRQIRYAVTDIRAKTGQVAAMKPSNLPLSDEGEQPVNSMQVGFLSGDSSSPEYGSMNSNGANSLSSSGLDPGFAPQPHRPGFSPYGPAHEQNEYLPAYHRSRPGCGTKLAILSARSFTHIVRDPSLLLTQLGVTAVVAALLGLIFWHVDNRLPGTQNRIGVLFFMVLYFSLSSLTSLAALVEEKVLFTRERDARYYSTLPYFFSKVFSDMIPLRVIPPMIFGSIAYHMIQLNKDPVKFATFLMVLVLANLTTTAACYVIAASTSKFTQANLVASLFFIFSMLFGGLLLNNRSGNSPLVRLQYASYFHYAYEALMVNEFAGLNLILNPPGNIIAPTRISGNLWLDQFGMDPKRMNPDIYVLGGIIGVLLVIAYLQLWTSRAGRHSFLYYMFFPVVMQYTYVTKTIKYVVGSTRRALRPPAGQVHVPGAASPSRSTSAHQEQILPKFGVCFDKITYSVSAERMILKGVTGYIAPGQLVGILGTSGAGKSSLMDILAHRTKTGHVTGFVSLVAESAITNKPKHLIGYVLQDDLMIPTQTVREALTFSARMRLAPLFTEKKIQKKVDKMMEDLAIAHIADSQIGSSDIGGGISGGERKRVAIGMELIADPRILLLDEPTSGLDSVSTEIVLRVLRNVAHNGCTCILTIHQPASNIFAMFDQVILLTKHGQQAYMGPPMKAMNHFERIGHPATEDLINPAEHMLEVASNSDAETFIKLAVAYRRSRRFRQMRRVVKQLRSLFPERSAVNAAVGVEVDAPVLEDNLDSAMAPEEGAEGYVDAEGVIQTPPSSGDEGDSKEDEEVKEAAECLRDEPATVLPTTRSMSSLEEHQRLEVFETSSPSQWMKFYYLCGRSLRRIVRDPGLLLTQLTVTVCVAIVIGLIFWDLNHKEQGTWNRIGVFLFSVVYFSLLSLSSISSLIHGRALFFREREARYYGTTAYFANQVLADLLPLRIFPSFLFAMITYFMMGLRTDDQGGHFGIYVLVTMLVNLDAVSLCLFCSAIASSAGQASIIASVYMCYSILYAGLLLHGQTGTASYIKYGSFAHYSWESYMINEFHGQNFILNAAGASPTNLTGDDWLEIFSLHASRLGQDIGILISISCLLLGAAYTSLKSSRYHK